MLTSIYTHTPDILQATCESHRRFRLTATQEKGNYTSIRTIVLFQFMSTDKTMLEGMQQRGLGVQAGLEPPWLLRHRVTLAKWKPVLDALEDLVLQTSALESVLENQGNPSRASLC